MSSHNVLYVEHFNLSLLFWEGWGHGDGTHPSNFKKTPKNTAEQTYLTIQWMWRNFPSSCVSASTLCPGRKARRPPGTSSRKTFRNSFGLRSWHAKITDIRSHALYFLCLIICPSQEQGDAGGMVEGCAGRAHVGVTLSVWVVIHAMELVKLLFSFRACEERFIAVVICIAICYFFFLHMFSGNCQ